jgi:uncharacterized membrane protein YhaH (DUF805 family)
MNERQQMFQNPFSFNGRIRRLEYGISYIIYIVFYIIIGSLTGFLFNEGNGQYGLLFFALIIPTYWFLITQGAKRCHDRNNSGWYQIIPFYGLWMLFGDSDYGENDYGPNPKDEGNENIEDMINDIGNPD